MDEGGDGQVAYVGMSISHPLNGMLILCCQIRHLWRGEDTICTCTCSRLAPGPSYLATNLASAWCSLAVTCSCCLASTFRDTQYLSYLSQIPSTGLEPLLNPLPQPSGIRSIPPHSRYLANPRRRDAGNGHETGLRTIRWPAAGFTVCLHQVFSHSMDLWIAGSFGLSKECPIKVRAAEKGI